MKQGFLKNLSLSFLIVGILFTSSFTFLIPSHNQAYAQLDAFSNVGIDVVSCAAGNIGGDLLGAAIGYLGSIVADYFGGAIGGAISDLTGGNEVPVKELAQRAKEFISDCIAWAVTKLVIEEIVLGVIGWINESFDGEPFYVQNQRTFYADLDDEIRDQFLRELEDAKDQLQGAAAGVAQDYLDAILVDIEFQGVRIDIGELITCEAEVQIGVSFEDYLDDPDNFSWDDYLLYAQDPACDATTARTIVQQELDRRLAETREEFERHLEFGDGFLPELVEGLVVTPAKVLVDQLNEVLTAGLDQLTTADELAEAISNFLAYALGSILSNETNLQDIQP